MGRVSFNLRGMEETLNKLDLTDRRVNSETNSGLRQAGEVVKSTIESNTPVLTGEAISSVITSNVRSDGGTGHKTILVGYAPNVAWRMWFLEDGTYSKGNPKGIRPRRMVEISMHQSEGEATAVLISSIQDALGG